MIVFRRLQAAIWIHACLHRPLSHACYSSNKSSVDFYNRHEEVTALTKELNDSPSFIVMLGPPSSGKTALVRHVVTQKRQEDGTPMFHPIFINLRGVDVSTKTMFKRAFVKETWIAAQKDLFWKKYLSEIEAGVGLDGSFRFTVKRAEDQTQAEEKDLVNVGEILDAVMNRLPKWPTALHGERQPVLVVDEANELKALAAADINTFKTFMKSVVKVTKEEQKMHVVFTSSHSFLERWLTEHQDLGVNSKSCKVLVLGDLTWSEAYNYYLELLDTVVTPKQLHHLFGRSKEDFDKVFDITGGRMCFIHEYVCQVCTYGPIKSVYGFSPLRIATTFLTRDLIGKAKTYSGKEALEVFKMLTSSSSKYLYYDEMCSHFGFKKVEEMILRSVLHLRPPSDFARDIQPVPTADIVTAAGQPELRAMEMLIQRWSKK